MKERKELEGQERLPYTKPTLTSYGSIAALTRTQAGNCSDNDNAFNNAQKDCNDIS
jgi:hypothetical protein